MALAPPPHRRYTIGEQTFKPETEVEGFTQLAAAQSAPDPDNPPPDDLYLNESMAPLDRLEPERALPRQGSFRRPRPGQSPGG